MKKTYGAHRKGQVTMLIVIAVVIVAAIVLVFMASEIGFSFGAKESPEVKEISSFVQDCLDQTAEEAVIVIGSQGGYNELPEGSNEYLYYPSPYYIDSGKNLAIDKQVLERELGAYIEENLGRCFYNFEEFRTRDIDVDLGDITANARAGRNEVMISAKIPLSITNDNSTSLLSDFTTSVKPVRFDTLLAASNEIAISETEDSRTICLTCIQSIAEKYGLSIDIVETENRNEFIFILTDEQSNFAGVPYEYSFAARYSSPDCADIESCFNALQ